MTPYALKCCARERGAARGRFAMTGTLGWGGGKTSARRRDVDIGSAIRLRKGEIKVIWRRRSRRRNEPGPTVRGVAQVAILLSSSIRLFAVIRSELAWPSLNLA